MIRTWYSGPCWLAICVATSFVGLPGPVAASSPVSGEMVDTDVPTTYRLPLVTPSVPAPADVAHDPCPLFSPPRETVDCGPPTTPIESAKTAASVAPPADVRLAQRVNTPSTPAGSPPDERLDDEPSDEPPVEATPKPTAPLATDVLPYTPTTAELTSQLLPAVQRGYGLAQRGALYAARTEFVHVLRRVAQAQDAATSTDEHSRALAAGLRALDEADDFVPDGIQLEAELDVRAVASSHRTPVLREHPDTALPHEAVAFYHSFAEERLAKAAAGEQAGSMALYGLGKIYARQAERRDDDVRFARSAMTMYSAALATCPHNHLAANELGVLLCRTGRPAQAAELFETTIDAAPSATAYHNLAVAQQKLGNHAQADANEQESQRLAAWERSTGAISRRAGIQWVSPEDLARVSQPAQLTPTAYNAPAAPHTPPKSRWW